MKILLTGGLGYIGSHICVELLTEGHDVIVIDNLSHSDVTIPHKIYQITDKCIILYNLDLRSEEIRMVFEKHAITHVIHLAGLKSVRQSTIDPLTYYDHNVSGTINLLKIMKEYQVNHLIYSSSATVYQPGLHLINETTDLSPSNPYGHTKLVVEILLHDLCKNTNFHCTILRYFNPIGNHASGLLIELNSENVMPKLCQSLMNQSTFIIYGKYDTIDQTAIRDYIHVVDLAKGHLACLTQSGYHIYNLGSGKGTSVLELLKTMQFILNKEIDFTYQERRSGDVAHLVCDASKIKQELGWETKLSIEDMCRDVYTALKINQLL